MSAKGFDHCSPENNGFQVRFISFPRVPDFQLKHFRFCVKLHVAHRFWCFFPKNALFEATLKSHPRDYTSVVMDQRSVMEAARVWESQSWGRTVGPQKIESVVCLTPFLLFEQNMCI